MSPDSDGLKQRLQEMGNYEFEHFIADLWERQGWTATVSQESVDAGVDVTAVKETPYPQKQLIQAKRYGENTSVGGPDIQQYASLKHQQRGVDSVLVVTTSTFTRHAEERAEELNVKLIDGDDLIQLVQNLDASDLIDEYAPSPEPESTDQTTPTEQATPPEPDSPGKGTASPVTPASSDSDSSSSGSKPVSYPKMAAALLVALVLVSAVMGAIVPDNSPADNDASSGGAPGTNVTPAATDPSSTAASSSALQVSFVNQTSSGDGVSDFNLLVRADTRMSDTDPEDENPGEPFFAVKVNNETIAETDRVERVAEGEFLIEIETEALDQFDDGRVNITVLLFDEDLAFDDEISRWSGEITLSHVSSSTPSPSSPTVTPSPSPTDQSDLRAASSPTPSPSPTTVTSPSTLQASFVNRTTSGDGVSDFDLMVRADTRLADTDSEAENPGEPFFVVEINNETVVETDQVERVAHGEFLIEIEPEALDQFDEGPLTVTVLLMDEDLAFDDEISRWSGQIVFYQE